MAATRKTTGPHAAAAAGPDAHTEAPGPTEIRSQLVRTELLKAGVWLGLALLIGLCIILIHPILLLFGGLVMASILDRGPRLLGRLLPLARCWRPLIVCLSLLAFLGWTLLFAGSQIPAPRSEESRIGDEWVSTFRCLCSP